MKKLLLLLVMTTLPLLVKAYDVEVDGIYYNLDQTSKTAEVTYYSYNSTNQYFYSGAVDIPSTINYNGVIYSVTSIGETAFKYCSELSSITIPSSVSRIGFDAFSGTGWFNNQPDGILFLDNWLIGYKGEKPIGNYVIPEGSRGIAGGAFFECDGLTSVFIPNSVTSIGKYAFEACSGLTTVTFPNSLKNIGSYAFSNCSSLKSVYFGNATLSIAGSAFSSCNSIYSVYITDLSAWCNLFKPNTSSPIFMSNYHLYLNGEEIKQLTIPESINSLGNYAFYGCGYFTSITIPNSVTFIGESTFEKCI